MRESEKRRAAVIDRLLSLNISTKKELEDIVLIASIVCESPIALLTLLKEDKQYIEYSIGYPCTTVPTEESFCRYTITQDEILEVTDTTKDDRFADTKYVTGALHARFYAGVPMKTKSGDNIGSICVLDTVPKKLNENQRKILKMLAQQAITILEFELSLDILKEEILKVQESELKLKTIFQSSHSCHLLIGREMQILACNKTASDTIRELTGEELAEGRVFTSLLGRQAALLFSRNFNTALSGTAISAEQEITNSNKESAWWIVDFNPAYNHKNDIIGVSVDATNITERVKDKQSILSQNEALKQIAQLQSHEIRRPVANIISLAELLREPDKDFGTYLA